VPFKEKCLAIALLISSSKGWLRAYGFRYDGARGSGQGKYHFSQCQWGSKAEIEPIFAKLTEGGNINHPLKEEFFGTYGDLIDRFSIALMFQSEGNAQ